jgi:flavodoxin
VSTETTRRALLEGLAGLSVASVAAGAAEKQNLGRPARNLVAYFTRSGNTRVVAGLIQRALGTDLFEIRPATPYPEDYLQTVEQASQEKKRGYEPPLAAAVPDVASYDAVYLCFPIWTETAPPVVRSFLKTHDLCGKILVPSITHGGFGLGDSLDLLRKHAPRARLQREFSMQADQERQTMNTVLGWLKGHKLARNS